MRHFALLLLLALPSLATAQKELPKHKEPKQSKFDPDVWNVTYNDGLPIMYAQAKEIDQQISKDAALKMWDAERIAQERAKIPGGGYVLVMLTRNKLEKADPHNLTIIIQDPDGKEIKRVEPESATPSARASGQYVIYSTTVPVPLDAPLLPGSKVFVADSFEHLRFEYIVKPQ
ncbi:hypothetical protein [Hymenobacter metallicola]|uniref:Uncharacterized protein n=1 Tax=Hymenobacter metallicola TaxID=2563114 RepID=A0A4Z0QJ62_9BACT|nr:hypothetical protein [Hymenobacter metallicola]TGE29735.1 hypothetical protein E5K02_09830 [Hymenobacter metallicola]